MSRNYKFHKPEGIYFLCFAVVEWIDVFTRNEYKDILLDSLVLSRREGLIGCDCSRIIIVQGDR